MSSKETPITEYPKGLEVDSFSMLKLSDRDAAVIVLRDLDDYAQLAAIHSMLRLCKAEDEKLRTEIDEIRTYAEESSGIHNEHAVEVLISHYHDSVYQDAAHSMAAVGMLAPFLESLFYQAFQGVGKHFFDSLKVPNRHDRWDFAARKGVWDCHVFWNKRGPSTNLVEGIKQLAEATELSDFLPEDLYETLQALFEYRNKMFHCGFEWELNERERFQQRIKDAKWPESWFSCSASGGTPWIFYMSNEFIEHCLEMIDKILEGIGKYCNHKLRDKISE